MTPTPAHRISRALARLGRRSETLKSEEASRGVEHATSVQLLDLLRESEQALTVDELSRQTGKHINTIRTHLDLLRAAGTITREKGARKGRGRPPWLYRAGSDPLTEADDLLRELTRPGMERADSDALAKEAAQRWAEHQAPAPGDAVETDEEAVDTAATALNHAGFRAAVSGAGDRIEITVCPYADLVANHPVICDIHTALLGEVLERTGRPVTVSRMDIWQPGNCVAHLRSRQLQPHRSIIPAEGLSDEQTNE